jgi:hypothetical protein
MAGSAKSRNSGEVPPLTAVPASPPAPHRRTRAAPCRPGVKQIYTGQTVAPCRPVPPGGPTAQIRLARGSNRSIPVNRGPFCKIALMLFLIQPALHLSSKVFAFRSCFFCLGPCSFSKSNPPSNIPRFSVLTPLSRV